jgi:hypothetical protein
MVIDRVAMSTLYLAIVASLALTNSVHAQPNPESKSTAENRFRVELPAHAFARDLLPESPFGINTALRPDAPDLNDRLKAMQEAGIKWGRQDFSWRRIETSDGQFNFEPYDRLVEACREHGIMLVGDLTSAPEFHDPRRPEGVDAYCRFARACVERYRRHVKHWQIWNEPNGGFWIGTPDEYARLLAASGKTIHEADPGAKVLGLNMAFCDVRWAERILKLVPYDCFDIACFHPYRAQCAPEEKFDWWMLDQYVKSWNAKQLTADYPLVRMNYLEQTKELVKVMQKFGEPKPLWVTEICWNTDIHPYGVSELRSADMLVRFYVLSIVSPHVEKVFWWTLRDVGTRQFDKADMVGLMRADLKPKYSYYALATLARVLEGKRHIRTDAFGPDIYAVTFGSEGAEEETIVAWATKPYAYVRITNEKGLSIHDVYGTKRQVPVDPVRTKHLPVPLGESPVYVVGAKGLKATIRPDPGW